MGSDDLFKKTKGLDIYSRKNKKNRMKPANKILIVCEGEKTEPLYFKNFKIDRGVLDVKVEGIAMNTLSLVNKAIEFKNDANQKGSPYNQVWCVFDKDSFPDYNFDNAIRKAEANNLRLAYSNEAFEIWFLLHFDYHNAPLSRTVYKEKLSKELGRDYKKNDTTIHETIKAKEDDAIKHAKKLFEIQVASGMPFSKCNPITTVHMLVEELRKWKK